MNITILVLAMVMVNPTSEPWMPPEDPDPQTILQEARADTRARRYETALAKHVWIHEHALSIDPAMYGVRLSFALSYWHELAKKYPPALEKLKELRERAAAQVAAGGDVQEAFHDMAAINRTLDDEPLTKEAFERLDAVDRRAAEAVFSVAQPALVRAKAYELLGKYVNPKADAEQMIAMYRQHKQLAKDPKFGDRQLDFANKQFTNDASTLIAILVVNERAAEAEEIAATLKAEWDDTSFRAEIAKALEGVVPEPWP